MSDVNQTSGRYFIAKISFYYIKDYEDYGDEDEIDGDSVIQDAESINKKALKEIDEEYDTEYFGSQLIAIDVEEDLKDVYNFNSFQDLEDLFIDNLKDSGAVGDASLEYTVNQTNWYRLDEPENIMYKFDYIKEITPEIYKFASKLID